MRHGTLVGALGLALGCSTDMGEVRPPIAGDGGPLVSWEAGAPPFDPPPDDAAPRVTIEDVAIDGAAARVSGTAADDRAVVALEVMVGHAGPFRVPDDGAGFAAWSVEVPVTPGPFELRVTAFDAGGRSATHTWTVARPAPADVRPPAIAITEPAAGHETNAAEIVLRGTASDDHGVARVEIAGEASGPLGVARTTDHFGRWALRVPLPAARAETFTARAVDVAGNVAEAKVRVVSRAAPPHGPPVPVIEAPADGETVATVRPTLSVRVTAEAEVKSVACRLGDGPWQPATPAGDRWVAPLRLVPGENRVRVVARDADGLVGRAEARVVADDGWSDGPHIRLAPPGPPGGEVALDLDREGVAEVFPPDLQRDTVLMRLDPRAMITDALRAIRDRCGPGWRDPDFEPDCPADWTPAVFNAWRLLSMTPRTTDVTGTRLEQAAAFTDDAYENDLLTVDFGGMLAEAMGAALDAPILPDGALVEALVEHLVATHPAAEADGRLPVTLEDGLTDMASLGERFGPSGEHPGVVAGPVRAEVLTSAFRMRLVLESNLRLYEGIDVRRARKDYFADHPDGSPVIALEFADPERFAVEGLVDRPRAALTFGLVESDLEVLAGERIDPRPRGRSNAWLLPPWTLERLVAEAAFRAFHDLRSGCDLCGGRADGALLYVHPRLGTDLAEVAIGRQGYDCFAGGHPCTNGVDPTPRGLPEHFELLDDPPPGWFRLWIPEGLVRTPPPMYVWELMLEVAQARLRDGGVPEGEGDAVFALEGVDVGLDAQSIERALRAELQQQRAELADRLLGSFAEGNGRVDVYLDRDAEGTLWLLAAGCPTPLPVEECRPVEQTGIYADPGLSDPVHAGSPWGLRGVPLAPADVGRVLYVDGGDGDPRRLEIEVVAADHAVVWVRQRRTGP